MESLTTADEVVRLTSNIAIEDIIRLDNIVDNLLGGLVHYQAFPLRVVRIVVDR